MTAMELLDKVVQQVKVHGYTPKEGATVVAAYKAGAIPNMEEALYIIAELLTIATEG